MGVSFNDYMKWRTPTGQVKFLDDFGVIGTHTLPHSGGVTSASKIAHAELIDFAKSSSSIGEYISSVKYLAGSRLPFCIFDLPF